MMRAGPDRGLLPGISEMQATAAVRYSLIGLDTCPDRFFLLSLNVLSWCSQVVAWYSERYIRESGSVRPTAATMLSGNWRSDVTTLPVVLLDCLQRCRYRQEQTISCEG